MKKSKLVLLTSILALTSLAACGGKANKSSSDISSSSSSESSKLGPTPIIVPEANETSVYDNTPNYYPEELLLNHRLISVVPREEYQLRVIEQFKYDGSNVVFESKNPDIATVDETGKVKGITSGETEILAYDRNNPALRTTVPVIVNTSLSLMEAQAVSNEFKEINEDDLTKIVDNEMYERFVYACNEENENSYKDLANYELVSYDRYDQRLSGSENDGYFRIWETDAEIKTKDGSYDFTNYEWIFYTNAFYDTYVYHQTGDVKNYLRVPTQSYMDAGVRAAPMKDILDNLFTSGSEIFTDMIGNAKLSKINGLVASEDETFYNTVYGSNASGQMLLDATIAWPDDTADQDDENRYGIPYGSPTPTTQGMRFTIVDNRIRSFAITQTRTYEINGVHYRSEVKLDHFYEDFTDESLYVPDRKNYTQVDSVFDV